MKNIYKFLSVLTILTLTIGSAYSVTAMQVLRNKVRTCTPYIYNVDGDPVIYHVVGTYNRKCVVRMANVNVSTECNFDSNQLKKFDATLAARENIKRENKLRLLETMNKSELESLAGNTETLADEIQNFMTNPENLLACKFLNGGSEENN